MQQQTYCFWKHIVYFFPYSIALFVGSMGNVFIFFTFSKIVASLLLFIFIKIMILWGYFLYEHWILGKLFLQNNSIAFFKKGKRGYQWMEIHLSDIETLYVLRKSRIGKILGYGTLVIVTKKEKYMFSQIKQVKEVWDFIYERKKKI